MPTYVTEKLPDAPIAVTSFTPEFKLQAEIDQFRLSIKQFLDALDEPVFWIADLRHASFSLADVTVGANRGASGDAPFFHHPNLKELIIVTNDEMVEQAGTEPNAQVFGCAPVSVQATLEAAMLAAYQRAMS